MQVKNIALLVIILVVILWLVGFGLRGQRQETIVSSQISPTLVEEKSNQTEIVATDLEIPWEIVFLDNEVILVAERKGRLIKIENGLKRTIAQIDSVKSEGEGGLLGMALHPNFSENKWLYLYMTVDGDSGTKNEVRRYSLGENGISDGEIILSGIEGAIIHNGGRLKFGPDGYLYVATGDANQTNLAQNLDYLAGKILRIKDDGSIPTDNPFENEIYSYGHRNVQGIAWDSEGRLWATEHGPSTMDEVNLIVAGGNYGWPEITGNETREGMITPVINSGTNETWAPSGMEIVDDWIYFVGLRGQNLYRMKAQTENIELERLLDGVYGRMRFIRFGKDGYFYIGTNNRDGRGQPKTDDDKIVKIFLE